MSHDRTGEPVDLDGRALGTCTCPRRATCPCVEHRCRNGFLSSANADEAVPCLTCRPHLRSGTRDIRILKPEWEQRS